MLLSLESWISLIAFNWLRIAEMNGLKRLSLLLSSFRLSSDSRSTAPASSLMMPTLYNKVLIHLLAISGFRDK